MNCNKLYKVVRFSSPLRDDDLTEKVNEEIKKVKKQFGHLGPVSIVSLSDASTNVISGLCTLTIEYTDQQN